MGNTRKATQRLSAAERKSQKNASKTKASPPEPDPPKKTTAPVKPRPIPKRLRSPSSHLKTAQILLDMAEPKVKKNKTPAKPRPGMADLESEDDDDEEVIFIEYNIAYKVPVGSSVAEVMISSTADFSEFLLAVTKKLSIGVAFLSGIAYIPSYKPKNPKPKPKLLDDDTAYSRMLEDIEAYRQACLAMYKGKGVVKPFTIGLFMDSASQPPKASPTGKKGGDKPALTEEDADLSEAKILQNIEKKHKCGEHSDKECYVLRGGKHYHYTFADKSIWTMLVRKGLATEDTPPEQLKLEDKVEKQEKISRKGNAAAAALPATPSQENPYSGMMAPPWMYAAPPWMQQMPQNQQIPVVAAALAPVPLPAAAAISPRKRVNVRYPLVTEWLESLDKDDFCGEDHLNFAQYGSKLHENGIIRLHDILGTKSAVRLAELGGMNAGIAQHLWDFAEEDRDELLEGAEATKKARVE